MGVARVVPESLRHVSPFRTKLYRNVPLAQVSLWHMHGVKLLLQCMQQGLLTRPSRAFSPVH